MKTTHETINEYCKEIAVSALPTTFRDTIAYARRLGLRFLWIDSLCIIQDDATDWQRESSQMANIYRNSYITLAAAKSTDGQGGLFSTASSRSFAHLLTYTKPNGTAANAYIRCQLSHCATWSDRNMEQLPLFRRGWAYQERLLSPEMS
jgi:hypothetical protein